MVIQINLLNKNMSQETLTSGQAKNPPLSSVIHNISKRHCPLTRLWSTHRAENQQHNNYYFHSLWSSGRQIDLWH